MLTKWRSLVVTGVMLSALVLLGPVVAWAQVTGTPTADEDGYDAVLVQWTVGSSPPLDARLKEFEVGYLATDAMAFGAATPESEKVRKELTATEISGLEANTKYLVGVRALWENDPTTTDDATAENLTPQDWQFAAAVETPFAAAPNPVRERDINVTPDDEELTIEWEEPDLGDDDLPISEYQVRWGERKDVDHPTTRTWSYAITTRSVVIDRLANETMYYVWIRAKNESSDWNDWSEPVDGTPMAPVVPPLTAPTGVTATGSDGMIEVSWGAVDGADSYEVSWMEVGGNATTNAMAMGTSHTIENVMNGTTYSVQVSAMMGDMKSPPSAAVTAMPMADPLDAPMNVMAEGGDSTIMVSWGAVERADSYKVSWSAGGVTSSATAMGTSHTIEGVTNGTEYSVTVSAMMGDMEGPASAAAMATPMAPPVVLEAPMNVMAEGGDSTIMVSWGAVEHADSYKVSWTAGGVTASATATGTSHTIENLMNGTEYSVTVSAMMGDMEGPASAAAMATPVRVEPVPALPLFGMLALGAGLVAAGRRRLHAQRLLKN